MLGGARLYSVVQDVFIALLLLFFSVIFLGAYFLERWCGSVWLTAVVLILFILACIVAWVMGVGKKIDKKDTVSE